MKDDIINSPDCTIEISIARKQLLEKLKTKDEEIVGFKSLVSSLKQENVSLATKLQQANLANEKATIRIKTQEELYENEIKMIKADYELLKVVNLNLQKELQNLAQSKHQDSRDIEFSFGPNNNYLPNFASTSPRTPRTSSPSKERTPPCFEGLISGNFIP